MASLFLPKSTFNQSVWRPKRLWKMRIEAGRVALSCGLAFGAGRQGQVSTRPLPQPAMAWEWRYFLEMPLSGLSELEGEREDIYFAAGWDFTSDRMRFPLISIDFQ